MDRGQASSRGGLSGVGGSSGSRVMTRAGLHAGHLDRQPEQGPPGSVYEPPERMLMMTIIQYDMRMLMSPTSTPRRGPLEHIKIYENAHEPDVITAKGSLGHRPSTHLSTNEGRDTPVTNP